MEIKNGYMVHLETLATPTYYDKSPADIMFLLDSLINSYLKETESEILNVVEYGFNPTKKQNGASGYARIAVIRKDPLYVEPETTKEEDNKDNEFSSSINI